MLADARAEARSWSPNTRRAYVAGWRDLSCILQYAPEAAMTARDRPLCDCPEPCSCYAEGYAAGKEKAYLRCWPTSMCRPNR